MTVTKQQAVLMRRAWPCRGESMARKQGRKDSCVVKAPSILGLDTEPGAKPKTKMGFACDGGTLLL